MNKGQIILIVGPTESGKTWLANCIQEMHGELRVVVWDEPLIEGRGNCRLAIIKHAEDIDNISIITTCKSAVRKIKYTRLITCHV